MSWEAIAAFVAILLTILGTVFGWVIFVQVKLSGFADSLQSVKKTISEGDIADGRVWEELSSLQNRVSQLEMMFAIMHPKQARRTWFRHLDTPHQDDDSNDGPLITGD